MTGGIEKEKGDKVEGNRIITMHVLGEEQETEKEYKGFEIALPHLSGGGSQVYQGLKALSLELKQCNIY